MGDQDWQDPLEFFHPKFLFQPLSESDEHIVESAKQAITTAQPETLTPEAHAKCQDHLREVIDTSPNKVTTASYLREHICTKGLIQTYLTIHNGCEVVKTIGRGRDTRPGDETEDETEHGSEPRAPGEGGSTHFSQQVKSGGICQVTGGRSRYLESTHILPFSTSNDDPKTMQYLELVKALFGPDALQRLLENVLNRNKDAATRNVNRLDNGIAMQPTAHLLWDEMSIYLEVLWETYNSSTKEFDAKFHWISPPESNMNNCWKPPLPNACLEDYQLKDDDIIPFRRRSSPPSSNSTAPSRISTPSPTRTVELPLASAHLLYVREIITHVAHAIGAAGYTEYDCYYSDDDVSVLAFDLGEKGTGQPSDLKQTEEKTSQVKLSQEEISRITAWAEMSGSHLEEQRNMPMQDSRCFYFPSHI